MLPIPSKPITAIGSNSNPVPSPSHALRKEKLLAVSGMIVYMTPKSFAKARSVDLQPQMTPATLLNPQNLKAFFPASIITNPSSSSPKLSSLKFPRKVLSFCYADDDHVLGDCVVFEEGVFEDPYLRSNFRVVKDSSSVTKKPKSKKTVVPEVQRQNLVPDHWTEVLAEIHMTKKERRKIAQEMEFNSRLEKKRKALAPIRSVNLEEYKAYREAKLAQLKPLVLDNPTTFPVKEEEDEDDEVKENTAERVSPKNPRWAVYGKSFDDVTEFFNSGQYVPGKSEARRKLFTKDEKTLLNRKIPHLEPATSKKWLPLHTLAASGEFYLTNILLKHNVDINAVDLDGWTALHKAVISKKQAITTYLLRESASPFVRDTDGATLMHYAVQTASSPAIKLLLLYNVDINLQDDDGWTPLHLAVQAQRTDIVKLLLIKGADKTVRNKDGLTPLELCLYCGRGTRTYELIKLLKQFPRKSTAFVETSSSKLLAS